MAQKEEPEIASSLLVEMFHCSSTEKNKEAYPKRSLLERDRFVGLFFPLFCVIGLENHGVEKEREKTEDKKQFDKKDGQVFSMVLDSAPRLSGDKLIDVVDINTAGKQEDQEENACDFLVMLIEDIGNRLDLLLRNRLFQPGSHSDDEECESADPDDRRYQMKPMVDDRNQRTKVGGETLRRVHALKPMSNGECGIRNGEYGNRNHARKLMLTRFIPHSQFLTSH